MLLLPILAVFLLTGCDEETETPLQKLARNAVYPSSMQPIIQNAQIADETYQIPENLRDENGLVLILWKGGSDNSAVIVYKRNDGRLIPLRYCPIVEDDIYKSGKNSHSPILDSIDERTTRVRCETEEAANNRGKRYPHLIIEGTSGGFLGLNEGEPTYQEFGID